jgi:RNA recognition motif-containing protein
LIRSQVRIIKKFGRSRGYAFVTVDQDAVATVLKLDEQDFNGRPLKVQVAVPKKVLIIDKEKPTEEKVKPAPKKVEPKVEPTEPTQETPKPEKKKRVRKPKERVPRDKSQLSETVLFVGNLPFSVDDDALRVIFDDDNILRCKVAIRFKRSKGFGLVEFKTPEDCAKALDKFQNALLDGRTLEVKRAYADVTVDDK